MSTRALIHIYDEVESKPFVTINKHYDGYRSSLGETLKQYVESARLTSWEDKDLDYPTHNGAACFAAGLIGYLKTNGTYAQPQWGDVYMLQPGAKDVGEEYVYHLRPSLVHDDRMTLVMHHVYENTDTNLVGA